MRAAYRALAALSGSYAQPSSGGGDFRSWIAFLTAWYAENKASTSFRSHSAIAFMIGNRTQTRCRWATKIGTLAPRVLADALSSVS